MKRFLTLFVMAILCLALVACGGSTCTHSDGDCNGKCDSCGADFGTAGCKDADANGKCDNCGKDMPTTNPDGVNLVSGGKANFQIVIGSDAIARNREAIQTLMDQLNKRIDGADFVIKAEKDLKAQDIEILIGSVTTRGEEYKLDKYSYGMKGYGIEIIGSKIVVVGGSETSLDDAIKVLERDVFGIVKAVEPITDLTVKESIHKPQNDYKIKSVKIGELDIQDFVFAIDKSSQARELATDYQQKFYEIIGYRPEIVQLAKLTEGQRAIRIENIERNGDRSTVEGFNVYIAENGDMMVECEFPNKLVEVAGALFTSEFLNTKKTGIKISSDFTYKKDVRNITYEQYGAKGDGKTDDFAAIREAHITANTWGHVVHATAGKVYYIGNKTEGKSIPVMTDTFWHGAKFIIDDSAIDTHNTCSCIDCKVRQAAIFEVQSAKGSVNVLDAIKATLENGPIKSSFDGATITKFENWPLNYDALVHMGSNERRVFVRMGANADNGDEMNEIILVHADGTIDSSTPITWTYTTMSWATAYSADDTPITIDGGGAIIETIANRPQNNDYIQYARNISVTRSNTKVCNFQHIVQEEQEFRAPYAGIIFTTRCHNITYENIVLQPARRKFVAQNNQQGTYEIGGYAANAIKFINVNANHFFGTGAAYDYKSYGVLNKAGELGNRGMMGSNYCRNFYFEGCRIVNFDSHKGMGNLTIVDCEIQSILIMGAGNILVKDTVKYGDNIISYRGDYGASFRGNITIENVEMKYSDESGVASNPLRILNVSYESANDYDTVLNKETGEYEAGDGSTNYMLTTLTVKNLKVTKYEIVRYIEKNEKGFNDIEEKVVYADDPLYIFTKRVSDHSGDISKFATNGGYSNKNRYIPPVSITIDNSYKNIVMPKSVTFKNTVITVDGKNINEE